MHPLTRPLNKLVVAVHHWVYERSGGRIGSSLAGQPMLMLYTVGQKSRQRRSSVLAYIRDGDRFAVVASNYGQARHPAWYHNLQANPDVEAQDGRERLALRARVAEGDERQRCGAPPTRPTRATPPTISGRPAVARFPWSSWSAASRWPCGGPSS